jgi:methionyl-tRNA formyltransferase
MRVLVLTTDQPNQAALVRKLAGVCEIVGVVLSSNVRRRRSRRIRSLTNRIAAQTAGRPFTQAWFSMLERYAAEHDSFRAVLQVEVDNINDPPTLSAIEEMAPDLVAVSGTNIVGQELIEAAGRGRGMVNLHTGISPYVKGGPNCTNWCLARGWFHLIGNTVMWIDAGVDSGNLIATEATALNGTESLEELHWKVMEHAHDLYVRSIAAIARGDQVAAVPQSEVGHGSTFANADWSALEMLRARWNFARHYSTAVQTDPVPEVLLVPLPRLPAG